MTWMSLEERLRAKMAELDITEEQFLEHVKARSMTDIPAVELEKWIRSFDTYLRRLALKAEEQTEQFP